MKKKIVLILLVVITFINSATITSLLSWSSVPNPANNILGWAGVAGVILFFPIIILIASDDAG